MSCPACGASTGEGQRFCGACGGPLPGLPAPPRPPTTSAGPTGPVDRAVPADLAPLPRERPPLTLWTGRGRTSLLVGCWAVALVLLAAAVRPLIFPAESGAASPEAAVEALLHGIADLDVAAVALVVDPEEAADPDVAVEAYDRLEDHLLRVGDDPPADLSAVLDAGDGSPSLGRLGRSPVAVLGALEMELDDLELSVEDDDGDRARVLVVDGVLAVLSDPRALGDELRGRVSGARRASVDLPLHDRWQYDGTPVPAYLVTVERDGRWYVSLRATEQLYAEGIEDVG